ncbi:MAG: ABC transporter ATP-binding protein [Gammaproteobacteria bacterium]
MAESAAPVSAGAYTLRKVVSYLPRFLAFTFSRFPLARLVLLLTVLMVILEYATLSLMLPLVRGGAAMGGVAGGIIEFWNGLARVVGLPTGQRTWLWLFLAMYALRIVVAFAQITLNVRVAKQVHAYLSDKVFRRVVMDEPLATIYRKTIGHYVSLAGDETHKAGNIIFYFGQLLAAVLSAVAGLLLLLSFSGRAFLLTLGFVAVCALLLSRGMAAILRISSESLDLSRALNTNFIEAMNGLRSVRSLSAEKFVVEGYRDQISRYVRGLFRMDALNYAYKAAPALLLVLVGMVWLRPDTQASGDTSTTVFFFAITTMLIRILTSLGEFVTASGKLVADIRASHDAGELLRDTPHAATGGLTPLARQIVDIELRDITCGYIEEKMVLREASCRFVQGHSYAVVGRSGSGKSTLADVVLGILPFSSGELLVDGIPFDSLARDTLRSRIILVEQQTRIFTGTLFDNVCMGRSASEADVTEALRAAGLEEFLKGLSRGLRTTLDYQGANISGGQRQRIGIARALVRRPDVLILDEGTSAVDPAMRRQLVSSLKDQFRSRILIFITHDGEVLSSVDEVWEIHNGRMEKGNATNHG